MANKIQLTPGEAETAAAQISEIASEYNDNHTDTIMTWHQMPGGNVQITVSKVALDKPLEEPKS